MEHVPTRGDAAVTFGSKISPVFEALEGRLLLDGTVPVFNTDIPTQWMLTPGSRGLTIGIDGYDADGDPLTISASSGNPLIHVSKPYNHTIAPILAVLHFTAADGGTVIGDITVQLLQGHANESLAAVARFISLATTGYNSNGTVNPTADPFYTNVLVHRVIDDFMIQTGDAINGNGTGGSPLGKFNDTFDPALGFQGIGVLAMANSGVNTNDCQFFITEDPTTWLDGVHMIFGQVISGWDIVQQISEVRVDAAGKPNSNIFLAGVDIIYNTYQDGSLEFIADAGFTGSANVTITLTDNDNNTVQKVITLTAASVLGTRPTVNLPTYNTVVLTGESGTVQPTFTDDHSAAVKSWIETEVPGLVGSVVTMDPVTHEISINIPANFDIPSFTVTVYAEEAGDYANLTASYATFTVDTAGERPSITDMPSFLVSIMSGQTFQFTPTLTDDNLRDIVFTAESSDPDVLVSVAPATHQVTIQVNANATELYAVTLSAVEAGFNSDREPTTKTVWVVYQNDGDPAAIGMIDLSAAGQTMGTALDNNILYVARSDAGLAIYDVSNPASPVLRDSIDVGGQAWDVQIQHTQRFGHDAIIAYVAMVDQGSAVVDVTDPANITLIRTLGTGSAAISLCVSGNLLYQSDWTYGLVVWDITNPDNIQWKQTIQQVIPASGGYSAYNLGYTVACDVQGNKAYVVDANGALFIITITTPTTYSVNSYYVTDGRPWDVVVQNNVAYILDESGGLIALDVTNPAAPNKISSVAISEMEWSNLAVSGTLAVLSTSTGFEFVDISDPAHMRVEYSFNGPTWGSQASIDGRMVALPMVQAVGVVMVVVDAPRVSKVLVRSSSWSQAFLNALGGVGFGIPAGPSQLDALPWTNINRISIVFSENVIISQGALRVYGLNTEYTITAFGYDSFTRTATWTLGENVDSDVLRLVLSDAVVDLAGNRLDGEWTNTTSTYPSGNGSSGGEFQMRINVLPCDADGNGTVGWGDLTALMTSFGGAAVGGKADFNGDGVVDAADYITLKCNFGRSLPAPIQAPAAAPAGDMPTAADSVQAGITESREPTMTTASPAKAGVVAEPELLTAPMADAPDADILAIAASVLGDHIAAGRQGLPPVAPHIANLQPSVRIAAGGESLLICHSPLPSPDTAGQVVTDVLQLAAPWWNGNSAKHEAPDEPWMTSLIVDIAGKPRKGRLDPIGLDVLAASR